MNGLNWSFCLFYCTHLSCFASWIWRQLFFGRFQEESFFSWIFGENPKVDPPPKKGPLGAYKAHWGEGYQVPLNPANPGKAWRFFDVSRPPKRLAWSGNFFVNSPVAEKNHCAWFCFPVTLPKISRALPFFVAPLYLFDARTASVLLHRSFFVNIVCFGAELRCAARGHIIWGAYLRDIIQGDIQGGKHKCVFSCFCVFPFEFYTQFKSYNILFYVFKHMETKTHVHIRVCKSEK